MPFHTLSLSVGTIADCVVDQLIRRKTQKIIVIGAGILGISIALEFIRRFPSAEVTILEKEKVAGSHASGRNSGVIHAGLYYQKNSKKADFAVRGNEMIKGYIEQRNLPLLKIGKVIVAKNDTDVGNLHKIYLGAQANGASVELLNEQDLVDYEPLAITHKKFLWSPNTAVASPKSLMTSLVEDFLSQGGKILYETKVANISKDIITIEDGNSYPFDYYVNCAGTGSLRLANKMNIGMEYLQLPVLGGYLSKNIELLPLTRLVYSAPHPVSPFLGVHFTQTLDGRIRVGPSAIPLLSSEQYKIYSNLSFTESIQSLKALAILVSKNPDYASKALMNQITNGTKRGMLHTAKELVPSTDIDNFWLRDPAGIRAQLIHRNTGKLVEDFVVKQNENSTHILNIVSPGWTSALPFAEYVVGNIISKDFQSP